MALNCVFFAAIATVVAHNPCRNLRKELPKGPCSFKRSFEAPWLPEEPIVVPRGQTQEFLCNPGNNKLRYMEILSVPAGEAVLDCTGDKPIIRDPCVLRDHTHNGHHVLKQYKLKAVKWHELALRSYGKKNRFAECLDDCRNHPQRCTIVIYKVHDNNNQKCWLVGQRAGAPIRLNDEEYLVHRHEGAITVDVDLFDQVRAQAQPIVVSNGDRLLRHLRRRF